MIFRCGIIGILSMFFLLGSVYTSVGQSELGKINCICIDAGHGGKDPGAPGSKVREKTVVLGVALKLEKMVREAYPDMKVIMVRDKDVFVELRDRTRIANKNKADLFISIHANALDIKKKPSNKYVKGVETFVLGTNSSEHNLKVAMKENSVIHYEDDYSAKYAGFDPSRAESYILFNMIRNLHLDNSIRLATMIQEELVKTTHQKDRGVRQAPLWVLKDVAMPATLVEIGYVTNVEEERFLMSSAGQTKLARAIFQGFKRYKNKIESMAATGVDVVSGIDIESEKATQDVNDSKQAPVFAIQVASATSRIKNSAAICRGMKVYELHADGRYRYYVQPSNNLQQVKGKLAEVKRKIKDCFIVAVHNNRIIPVSQALKLIRK